MLTNNVAEALAQAAVTDPEQPVALGSMVNQMSSYYQIVARPMLGNKVRDCRELETIARCLDLLRNGKLPELGHALAGRFLAVESAGLTNNWTDAQSASGKSYPCATTASHPRRFSSKLNATPARSKRHLAARRGLALEVAEATANPRPEARADHPIGKGDGRGRGKGNRKGGNKPGKGAWKDKEKGDNPPEGGTK